MKNRKEQTLFHASSFIKILAILDDKGFKASYCKENIEYGFNRGNKVYIPYQYYIPMISFTDMSLSSMLDGESTYGDCAIGMNIEWAKNNGLNPVLYIEKDSRISRSIWKLLNSLQGNMTSNKLDLAATSLMQSIKNYEGKLNNRSKIYYDEREWRYIPELDESTFPSFIDMGNFDKLVSFGQKPHITDNAYLLRFNEKDIDYIIVDNRHQKKELCKIFRQNIDIAKKVEVRKSWMF